MRLVGNLEKEYLARKLSLYLSNQGIDNTVDVQFDIKNEKTAYTLWVINEDDMEIAVASYKEFLDNPDDAKFNISLKDIVTPPQSDDTTEEEEALRVIKPNIKMTKPAVSFQITSFFFILCVFIFSLNFFQEYTYNKKEGVKTLLTPVQYYLLYDVPYVLIQLDKLIRKYDVDLTKKMEDQPKEFQSDWVKIENKGYWQGFYEIALNKWEKNNSSTMAAAPLFEKIRQGQVWRLITPCFLHKDFLHILFNMIWLWVLGKQVERRLGRWKYILLVVIIGVITNTMQYIASGPYFLGYSGIVMGMVGFIWMRQKTAPWEGYPLPKVTIIFLGFYVLVMLGLQLFSFFTKLLGSEIFTLNIANTAHISGVIIGAILGKIPLFAWRPHER